MGTLASRPRTVADVPSPSKAPFVIFPFQEVTTTRSRRRLSFHSANPIPSARSGSFPSPYLSGSVSSLGIDHDAARLELIAYPTHSVGLASFYPR